MYRAAAATCFICALLGAWPAVGEILPPANQLYGFISVNRTLTKATPGPTYELLGDLVIMPGATLTIEPGVQIWVPHGRDTLQGGVDPSRCEIEIRGALVAQGVPGDSIRLTSTEGGHSGWTGLVLRAGGSVQLRRVLLLGARTGLDAREGSGTVQESAILAARSGIDLSPGYGLDLGGGVSMSPFDSSRIEATTVAGYTAGVFLRSGASVQNVVAHHNDYGFHGDGHGFTVEYCTAAYNYGDGIRIVDRGGIPNSRVENSIAAGNLQAGIRVLSDNSGGTLIANYLDSWQNNPNYQAPAGSAQASFNPFFVDAASNDYRLSEGSAFKHFSSSGGEIGAYGPSGSPTTAVPEVSHPISRVWPNPTRGPVHFELPDEPASLQVLDLSGRVIRHLERAGNRQLVWDARDQAGRVVAPGVYMWRAGTGIRGRIVVLGQ